MKTPAFPWHESPLAQPTIWAGAFEVLTYTQAFHYALGNYLHPTYRPGKGLSVRCKFVASDPEVGFEYADNLLLTLPQTALEADSDEAALDVLVEALRGAIDERPIHDERTRWLDAQAREHADIQAHNDSLDAWLQGGG